MTIEDDDSWRDQLADVDPTPRKPPLKIVGADTRPDIPLVPDVHLTTERMISVLVKDPEVYSFGGSLTHVVRTSAEEAIASSTESGDGKVRYRYVEGTPTARTMPVSYAVDRVSLHARCVKRVKTPRGHDYVHVPPPRTSVLAAVERGSWPGVRVLRGIIEAPALRPDGTVIQEPGFDRSTGYLFVPNAEFPTVPESPTHSDCVLAYARLAEPFADFPYVNEAHRAAVVSAILTLLARPAIRGAVPCYLFDASTARSGKSLQVDVISLIVTGRAASRMTYPEQDEELEKVLSAYAVRAVPMVNFDNVARKFGGAALDKVITAVDQVDLRVLGATDLRTFDWRAVVFASGNNVECRGDMLPRVLSPRLETALDNPETRTDLRYPDLRAHVLEHRAELVAAALTLLRGYVVDGRPDMSCPRWGGFEPWSRLIPHALRWVGAEDPMGARRGLAGDADPDQLANVGLVEGWARLSGLTPGGLTVKQALAVLYPERSHHDGPREPDAYDDLREVVETVTNARPGYPPSARALGDRLRKLKDKPVNGRRLVGTSVAAGTIRWRVTRVG